MRDIGARKCAVRDAVDVHRSKFGSRATPMDVGAVQTYVFEAATDVGAVKTSVFACTTDIGAPKTYAFETAADVAAVKTSVLAGETDFYTVTARVCDFRMDVAAVKPVARNLKIGVFATRTGVHVQVSGSIRADARNRHAMPIAATAVMDVPRPVHDLSPTTT